MNGKKEKMTLDKLALMVGKGFSDVDKRFDSVDERFDKVEKDLKEMKEKVNGFIDGYNEEKLPIRVEYIENTLNLPKK